MTIYEKLTKSWVKYHCVKFHSMKVVNKSTYRYKKHIKRFILFDIAKIKREGKKFESHGHFIFLLNWQDFLH